MTRYVCTRITLLGDRYTVKETNPLAAVDWMFRALAQGSTPLVEIKTEEVEVPKSPTPQSDGQQSLNVGVDRLPCPRCGLAQCSAVGYVAGCVRTGQALGMQ